MAMIVDTASAVARLSAQELAQWATTRTVFLSSEMRDLGSLRAVVADTLRRVGFRVVWFEDLGGRDEDAQRAYLDGVARSDIYVGILADRYGTMLPSGRSPTHEEYLEARRRGKRISFWLQRDASGRQGHAADFAQEVQTFHTTGQFTDADDLSQRLVERMAEIAADDEAPWLKIGDICLRARRLRDEGKAVRITAEVRDSAIVHALEQLRPSGWGQQPTILTTARRSGEARIASLAIETRAASVHEVELVAEVSWADGRPGPYESGFNGFSPDEQTEAGLRAGLFGEPLPARLDAGFSSMVDTDDPLAPIRGLMLPPAAEEAVGRLLLVEKLVGGGRASRVEQFSLGPLHLGTRRVELEWVGPRRYADQEPGIRRIEGVRRSPAT